MARSRFVWRFCLWWCLLLCVLPTVEAASKTVNLPSLSDQMSKGSSTYVDSVLTLSTAIEGEFIPGATKNVPVRGILGGTTFGLNTIVPKAKSLVKGGLVAVAAGYAFDKMIDGLGWVMSDGAVVKSIPPVPASDIKDGDAYWQSNTFGNFNDPSGFQAKFVAYWGNGQCSLQSSRVYTCTATLSNGATPSDYAERIGTTCAPPRYAVGNSCALSATGTTAPVADADLISMDSFIAAQNSDFVKELLRQSCAGSNNPNGCYQSLRKQQLDLRGPATVDAGTTTTTTTHPNADGTVSKTVTNNNTKYNIVYGPTNYSYTKNTTSTTSTDGKPGDTTTEEEQPTDDPADEDTPDDDVAASPCAGVDCDGPKYESLYKSTKDTKEQALDSYSDRVKSLPILSAIAGFFTVSASAGCPSWSTTVDFAVMSASFHSDLVFDFHCQPWFVAIAQYAKIVISIVCAYLAFRQAILD